MFLSPAAPSCFGRGYDNESPRCIACGFNNPCRQEVIRMSSFPQFAPPSAVVQPTQFYPGMPAPAPFIPVPPPMMVQTQPQPAQWRPPPWNPPQPAPNVFRVPVQQAQMPQQPMPQQPLPMHAVAPWSPIHFPVPASLGFSQLGYLGYYQDPGAAAIWNVPAVIHPQQPGESFGRRARIEFGRHLGGAALQFSWWLLRQMIFSPPLPPASQQTVDVTP